MDIEGGLVRLQEAADRLVWQMDHAGVAGVGVDESGTVRIQLDDAGQVQQVDIGRMWWRDVGPGRLSEAIFHAANQSAADRLRVWSDRVAEREGGVPPADWRSPMNRQRGSDGSDELYSAQTATTESRAEDLLRTSEATKAAMSELDDYRHRLEARARQQVIGRGRGDRVTVVIAGGQIAEVEISQRWLREQPSGQVVGSEVLAACRDAYNRSAKEETEILAGLPGLAALREFAADPAALLRRLELGR